LAPEKNARKDSSGSSFDDWLDRLADFRRAGEAGWRRAVDDERFGA
jgi:hypothetical protein